MTADKDDVIQACFDALKPSPEEVQEMTDAWPALPETSDAAERPEQKGKRLNYIIRDNRVCRQCGKRTLKWWLVGRDPLDFDFNFFGECTNCGETVNLTTSLRLAPEIVGRLSDRTV